MKSKLFILSLIFIASGCLPKDSVQLRDVKNLGLTLSNTQVITGDAVFYNPNSSRMKLRQVKIDVFLDDKKTAFVDQDTKVVARGNSEFTIPVTLNLMEGVKIGDLLKDVLFGKKHIVHYKGYLKVNVNGFPVRIPIDHSEELKLSM